MNDTTDNVTDFESDEMINREISRQLEQPEKKKSGVTDQAQRRQDEAVARQDKARGIPPAAQAALDKLLGRGA